MLKIITYILTKMEKKLSKKVSIFAQNAHSKLMLYRDLLNRIDRYNYQENNISTFRHYRYKTFTVEVDDLVEKVKE